jgi:hypothetical protein
MMNKKKILILNSGKYSYFVLQYLQQSGLYQNCRTSLWHETNSAYKTAVVGTHTIKTYRKNGGIAALILNPGTRQRSVVSLTLWYIYLEGKCPKYPLKATKWVPKPL